MVDDHDNIVHGVFMVSSILFDWHMAGWWSQCTKYSTTQDHHSHVIFIMVSWLYCKRHALGSAVAFLASFFTIHWMRLMLLNQYFLVFTTWKQLNYTNMNKIQSLFWQKIIHNQPKISCLWRWWWNIVGKANYLFSTLNFSLLFCSCLLYNSDI